MPKARRRGERSCSARGYERYVVATAPYSIICIPCFASMILGDESMALTTSGAIKEAIRLDDADSIIAHKSALSDWVAMGPSSWSRVLALPLSGSGLIVFQRKQSPCKKCGSDVARMWVPKDSLSLPSICR